MKIGNIKLKNDLILAPMAGVTDPVFRGLCVRFGAALTFSEMISAKGMFYQNENTYDLLAPAAGDAPQGVQLFGKDAEIIARQACDEKMNAFQIIDFNMGCPAKKITGNGEGSALMASPKLAYEILYALCNATDKPVTVKIRAGIDSIIAPEFARIAEQAGCAAITVHARTAKQGYSGKADLDIIRDVKRAVSIPVIGNGDVKSADDVSRMRDFTHCDGVMIGRAAQGKPWIFSCLLGQEINADKDFIVSIILEHAEKLALLRGERTAMLEMRKHTAWYTHSLRRSAALRGALNSVETLSELRHVLTLL